MLNPSDADAVDDDPTILAKGTDPQLERAIKEVMERAAKLPPPPQRPPYEKRVPIKTENGGR